MDRGWRFCRRGARVRMLAFAGGEAQALTHLKNGASAFQWSPDGKRLVVVSRSGPSDNVKASDQRRAALYAHSVSVQRYGWYDDKRPHLFVVNAAVGGGIVDAVKGDAKQITSGDAWNDTDPQKNTAHPFAA